MRSGSRLAALVEAAFRRRNTGLDEGGDDRHAELEAEISALAAGGVSGICNGITQAINSISDGTDRLSLAVTGMGWLGAGVPAVERTLTELLASAEQEMLLTVYSMTPGTGRVWEAIEKALATGIRCTLVANRIDEQHPDIRSMFLGLADRYPGVLRIYNFMGADNRDALHAKLVIVDRKAALVGSANLTFHGMVSAHELAIVVRGPTVDLIATRVDLLLQSRFVRKYPG